MEERGGRIETSGRFLEINQAQVSTIAPLGKTGTWLLDPGNINITDSASEPDPISDPTLPSFPVSSDTDIHPTSIVNALGSNSVSIQTGSGSYDLTVSSPIFYTGSNGLTLVAGQDVIINAAIDVGSGTLTVNADDDISISADLTTTNSTNSAIYLNAGKDDDPGTSSGGNISISGSPTISVGGSGRATFLTGSITGSTGLTNLIGSW